MTEQRITQDALDAILDTVLVINPLDIGHIHKVHRDALRLLEELQRERDYSAAVHADYDNLFQAGMRLVRLYDNSFEPVEDIAAAVDDLKMALDRTEAGSEEEKAEEVATLRQERDDALAAVGVWQACAQKAAEQAEAECKRADEAEEARAEFAAMRQERNALQALMRDALVHLDNAARGGAPYKRTVARMAEEARGLGVDVDALRLDV